MTDPEKVTIQESITALEAAITGRLDEANSRLDRIDRTLLGEELIGHVGLVERVREVEQSRKEGDAALHKRVDKLEFTWVRARWLTAGAALGAGLTGGGLGAYIANALMQH